MIPERFLYHYNAHITAVYDGDTVTADIDLGLNVWLKNQKLRLYKIGAPEVRGEERPQGLVSRDALRELILDKDVVIRTHRDRTGKYGRWLAEIFVSVETEIDTIDISVNDWMLQFGYATELTY